jgi:hypothetical protein
MSKYLRYVMRAFALASLLAEVIPKYLEDGKITLDELVDLARRVLEIGGWKAEFDVPENVKDIVVGFELLKEEPK